MIFDFLLKITRVFNIGPATFNDRLRQKFEYSETFSLGVPQVDITGHPGTLNRYLLIFGKKYW